MHTYKWFVFDGNFLIFNLKLDANNNIDCATIARLGCRCGCATGALCVLCVCVFVCLCVCLVYVCVCACNLLNNHSSYLKEVENCEVLELLLENLEEVDILSA